MNTLEQHGGVAVSTVTSQQAVWKLSVWNLHVLIMPVWVSSRHSDFLLPHKDMQMRSTGSLLYIACGCECECGWLFFSVLAP